ncbi:helix-turn-helix domain-containing protein [Pseudomonas sp. 21LCFQ010]|uniref:LexA family transcriptional regulator n=1 Tax=Pseudomonas sp. 21LCFQ010 TaxID=2957506 RepID=UPI0020973275|nr:XRE family transcriptional regulator [Pseudomonas sp. 21LCFQ010]MCO8161044.1 helix-turn-helix domain-containing protein [Pseudomonas sp. 21LCFQ010]
MHKTIDKILAALMQRDGINQLQLSQRSGVGQSTISRILKPGGTKGIKEPTDKQVRPLADFFGVSTDQLRGFAPLEVDGTQAELVEEPAPTSSADKIREMLAGKRLGEDKLQKLLAIAQGEDPGVDLEPLVNDAYKPGKVGDEVWIAHYDIRGAMGGGEVTHDYPEMLQDVRVSPSQLRAMGVEFKEHFHLKMITGWGQSMAPTIKHGDPLLVDISVNEFVGDGIYFFSYQGFQYIKRLQMKGKDKLKMISDNRKHKAEDIWLEETYIQARVLLVWNANLV